MISKNRWPLELVLWQYLTFAGDSPAFEYYLRCNDVYVRLVEWGHGNHWRTESDHTYYVETSPRRVLTVRSKERRVYLN